MNAAAEEWYHACRDGDLGTLKKLIHEGNVNQTYGGYTALVACVRFNHYVCAEWLVARDDIGCDLNRCTKSGKRTALHFAHSARMAILLIRAGAIVHVYDNELQTPLARMLLRRNVRDDAIHLLLDHGAVVEPRFMQKQHFRLLYEQRQACRNATLLVLGLTRFRVRGMRDVGVVVARALWAARVE